jgi:vacuolar-type H+-ATPase subunit E/Vma4
MTKQAIDDNVDALARAIISEAQAEAQHIQTEVLAKAEGIMQKAQIEAGKLRRDILQRAEEEAKRLNGQSIATAQMKARKMQLEHREKLLDRVFAEAEKQLANIQQWTDYPEIAHNLLREAVLHLRAKEVRVRADQKTLSVLAKEIMKQVAQEFDITIEPGDTLPQGIGLIVETKDGRRQYDNTLDNRLRRMQGGLRAPVYQLLMGEKI